MTDAEKAQRSIERDLLKRQRHLNRVTLLDVYEGVSPEQLLADLAEARAHARMISQTHHRLCLKEGDVEITLRPFWCDHLLDIAIGNQQEALAEALLPEWMGQDASTNAIGGSVQRDQPAWTLRLLTLRQWQNDDHLCQYLYELALEKATLSTLTTLLTHLAPVPAFALVDRSLWRHTLSERDVANFNALLDAGAPILDDTHPAKDLLARLLIKGQFDLADRVWALGSIDIALASDTEVEVHTQALQRGLKHALALRDPVWVDRLIGMLPTDAGNNSWEALRDSLKEPNQGMDLIVRQARHLGLPGVRDCWLNLAQDRQFEALDRMATLVPTLWSQTLMDMSTPAERERLPQTLATLRQQDLTQRPAAAPSRSRRRS